jgi:enterochelin esterase-like enzyme
MYINFSSEKYEKERNKWINNLQHRASKNLTIFENAIYFNEILPKRTIAVYLPAGYETDTISYPVFYFF